MAITINHHALDVHVTCENQAVRTCESQGARDMGDCHLISVSVWGILSLAARGTQMEIYNRSTGTNRVTE